MRSVHFVALVCAMRVSFLYCTSTYSTVHWYTAHFISPEFIAFSPSVRFINPLCISFFSVCIAFSLNFVLHSFSFMHCAFQYIAILCMALQDIKKNQEEEHHQGSLCCPSSSHSSLSASPPASDTRSDKTCRIKETEL